MPLLYFNNSRWYDGWSVTKSYVKKWYDGLSWKFFKIWCKLLWSADIMPTYLFLEYSSGGQLCRLTECLRQLVSYHVLFCWLGHCRNFFARLIILNGLKFNPKNCSSETFLILGSDWNCVEQLKPKFSVWWLNRLFCFNFLLIT